MIRFHRELFATTSHSGPDSLDDDDERCFFADVLVVDVFRGDDLDGNAVACDDLVAGFLATDGLAVEVFCSVLLLSLQWQPDVFAAFLLIWLHFLGMLK